MTKGLIPIIVLAALICVGAWAVVRFWGAMGPAAIPLGGYVAFGAGLVTLALAIGGMVWLAFYSERKGYDDIDRKDS